jgi:hypothetical protein
VKHDGVRRENPDRASDPGLDGVDVSGGPPKLDRKPGALSDPLHAHGLTVRQVLDKFAAMQLLDVHFPTTDRRELLFPRHTEPDPDQQLLLAQIGWTLPAQPPPRITAKRMVQM